MSNNILILSTGDVHGAYEAAYKIAKFLHEVNYNVTLVVKHKTKSDPFIKQIIGNVNKQSIFNRLIKKTIRKLGFKENSNYETEAQYFFFTKDESIVNISAELILEQLNFVPDLIISGMTDGFCTTTTLQNLHKITGAKIYTWLVDMEPLTGGCHYSWGCKGYETDCQNCPAIIERGKKDKAHSNLMIKLENVKKANIKVLSGSQWVTEQARNSTLFKFQSQILCTNACIDTRILNGKNRAIAKQLLDIPSNAKVIFTGSWNVNDPRKGIKYYLDALQVLWNTIDSNLKENVYILIAGEHYQQTDFLSKIPFKKKYIDYIKDYRYLSLVYQASDIFVCASIEDSGPMMVSEALACGTPVVGFRMGNVYSMVKNGFNGYVAELKNTEDLAFGLNVVLSLTDEEFQSYSKNSIDLIEKVASHNAVVRVIESLFF